MIVTNSLHPSNPASFCSNESMKLIPSTGVSFVYVLSYTRVECCRLSGTVEYILADSEVFRLFAVDSRAVPAGVSIFWEYLAVSFAPRRCRRRAPSSGNNIDVKPFLWVVSTLSRENKKDEVRGRRQIKEKEKEHLTGNQAKIPWMSKI